MHRFLSHQSLTQNFSLNEGPRFHQISRVFRAKKGDKFIFFEPFGDDKVYEVVYISKKHIDFIETEVIHQSSNKRKKKEIIVLQALPNKIHTLELLIQKLVEIGISKVIFFASEHSQLRNVPTGKIERMESIAEEALEQSGGNSPITIIYKNDPLEEIFDSVDENTQHIIGYPKVKNTLTLDEESTCYALWIGPEGGWSEKEIMFFQKQKCLFWTFNHGILRLETACIVGAGILSYSLE